MNGKAILVDTNILIYFFEGRSEVKNALEGKHLYVSSITVIELLGYAQLSKDQENLIRNFLAQCQIIELDEAIRERTITIRKQHKIKTPDAIIAASALEFSIPLLTKDQDFIPVEGLEVVSI